jgi:hypothetical protein
MEGKEARRRERTTREDSQGGKPQEESGGQENCPEEETQIARTSISHAECPILFRFQKKGGRCFAPFAASQEIERTEEGFLASLEMTVSHGGRCGGRSKLRRRESGGKLACGKQAAAFQKKRRCRAEAWHYIYFSEPRRVGSGDFLEFEFGGVAEGVEDAEKEIGGDVLGIAVHDGGDAGAGGAGEACDPSVRQALAPNDFDDF